MSYQQCSSPRSDTCTTPSQNHRIGHIRTLKLVETQHIPFLGDISSHQWHGVDIVPMLHVHLMQPLVNVLHEVMEVNACLARDGTRQRVIEQIHQHRLPTAHVPKQIQASGQVLGDLSQLLLPGLPVPKDPAEHRSRGRLEGLDGGMYDARRMVPPQFVVEMLQTLYDA